MSGRGGGGGVGGCYVIIRYLIYKGSVIFNIGYWGGGFLAG